MRAGGHPEAEAGSLAVVYFLAGRLETTSSRR